MTTEETHYHRLAVGLMGGGFPSFPPPFLDLYGSEVANRAAPFRVGELVPWKKMWLRVEDVGKNWLKLGVTGVVGDRKVQQK